MISTAIIMNNCKPVSISKHEPQPIERDGNINDSTYLKLEMTLLHSQVIRDQIVDYIYTITGISILMCGILLF